ncbi:carbonic anhydrase [Aquimarina macrocephali]|uniref:carbonic anhydrase n=1 Tax=Aquimarina macrocephali TaxID=666563 RepID=UPI003F672EF2
MKIYINTVCIVAITTIIVITSCTNTKEKIRKEHSLEITKEKTITTTDHAKKHWSYVGETSPEHWAEIEKNSDCGGKFQSPINIVSLNAIVDTNLKPLAIHYVSNTKIHDVVNNGHSIQYNFEEGDYLMYKDTKYNLKQIHFHESSEHTINGIRYPIVIHMVHTNSKGEYLVLAVMAKEGKTSAPFRFLESYLPVKNGETKTIGMPFNLSYNLPKDKGYYTYVGSLTTPPCTQGVNWFIFKEPITISLRQVKILRDLMPLNNYRNEQPLNGREVKMTK